MNVRDTHMHVHITNSENLYCAVKNDKIFTSITSLTSCSLIFCKKKIRGKLLL